MAVNLPFLGVQSTYGTNGWRQMHECDCTLKSTDEKIQKTCTIFGSG